MMDQELDPRIVRTRAAVLDVAVELLVEGGVRAVTVEAVVQRSGVARSTIYRHWPRRIDLVADTFSRLIPPLPVASPAGDLGERLRGVLRVLAGQMADEKYAAVVPAVLDSAARDPDLAGFRDRFAEAQRAPLVQILAAAAGRELSADIDVDGAVSALVGPLFFRRVVLAQGVDVDDADRAVEHFLRANGA